MCAKGKTPQKKATKKDKHFTLLGLTLLTGEPLMCVIIFAGEKSKDVVELGIDPFCKTIYGIPRRNSGEWFKTVSSNFSKCLILAATGQEFDILTHAFHTLFRLPKMKRQNFQRRKLLKNTLSRGDIWIS